MPSGAAVPGVRGSSQPIPRPEQCTAAWRQRPHGSRSSQTPAAKPHILRIAEHSIGRGHQQPFLLPQSPLPKSCRRAGKPGSAGCARAPMLRGQQERRGPVRQRCAVPGRQRARPAQIEDRSQLAEFVERGIGAHVVVGLEVAEGHDQIIVKALSPGSGRLMWLSRARRSWSSRLMFQVLTMSSQLCPIDSPVRGSRTAGSTGLKSRGRSPNQGFIRSPKLRPRYC